jgi:signal transduction histidine kinase
VNPRRRATDQIGAKSEGSLLVAIACPFLVLLVGVLDYLTGVQISFSIFYLIPISLATWYVGLRNSVIVAVLSAVTWLADDTVLGGREYAHPTIPVWNAGMRLGVFLIVAGMLSRLKTLLAAERSGRIRLSEAYAELDRSRQEQLLVKDQLLSHVSHELRTPLTAAHHFVAILLDDLAGPLAAQQREYLEIVRRNISQLERLIQDLVEGARVDAGKISIEHAAVALKEAIEDVVESFRAAAAEKGIELVVDCPDGLPRAWADPARVRQVPSTWSKTR